MTTYQHIDQNDEWIVDDFGSVVGLRARIDGQVSADKNFVFSEVNQVTGGVEISVEGKVVPVSRRKVPDDLEIMFYRPTGQQKSISVPTPYSDIANPYVIHPSVVYIPEKFAGYQYWMAYTPLNGNDSRYENPCICASNDLINWVLPSGCPNPVYTPVNIGVAYNRDTHLYYYDGQLILLWNTRNEGEKNRVKISTSLDGSAWSAPTVIWEGVTGTSDIASPSIWYDPVAQKWVIVGHNCDDATRAFRKITSSALLSGWDASPSALTFPNASGRKWWHSWFTRLSSGRIVGVAMDNDGGAGTSGYIYVAQSMDGAVFESAVIQNSASTSKPSGVWYRSTPCFIERDGGIVDITLVYSFTSSTVFTTQQLSLTNPTTDLRAEYRRISGALAIAGVGAVKGVLAATGFAGTDSATGLPNTLDGKVWTQINGTDLVGISGNMAYNVTTGNCIATLDVGSVNYSISAVVGAVGTQGYVIVNRKDATHFWRIGHVNGVLQINRFNGTLDINPLPSVGDPLITLAAKDILRIDVSGQTAKFYWNSILLYTADGTLFANNSIVGLQASGATPTKFAALTVESL